MSQYDQGVDIVVVNYRTTDDLERFVRSYLDVATEVLDARLTVIDVAPEPSQRESAERLLDDLLADELLNEAFFVRTTINIGYARACNLAAALIESDTERRPHKTIGFFNADTVLKPGVIDAMHWRLHQGGSRVGIVGPKQVDSQGRITHAGILGTNTRPDLRGWHQPDRGQFDEYREDCVSVSGSAYFVNRECWDELTACPGFNWAHNSIIGEEPAGAMLCTDLFYEETFCSYHARQHDWKIAYDGNVEMVHEWHQSVKAAGAKDRILIPKARTQFRAVCDLMGISRD